MGTRRSRHNKGRKPEYKDFRQNLVEEPSPFFERAEFDEDDGLPEYDPDPETILPSRGHMKPRDVSVAVAAEVAEFIKKRGEIPVEVSEYQAKLDAFNREILDRPDRFIATSEQWSTRHISGGKLGSEISRLGVSAALPSPVVKNFLMKVPAAPNSALVAQVEQFLSQRRTAVAPIHDDETNQFAELPAWARPTSEPTRPSGTISPNDIIAQLFFDKTITGWQASAGRRWQRYMQEGTIQPSTCVDWSEPVSRSFGYQPRGEVTERQWTAMKFRASIGRRGGRTLVGQLDFALDFDVGISGLRTKLRLGNRQCACFVRELLNKLCDCIAALENGEAAPYASWWRSENGKPAASREPHGVSVLRPSKTIPEKNSSALCLREPDVSSRVLADIKHGPAQQKEAAGVV